MTFQQVFEHVVELLDCDAEDFGEGTLRSIEIVGRLFDPEGVALSTYKRQIADDATSCVPSPENKRARAMEPETFQLTKHQAQHVLDVLRDADMDRCPECGPIREDIEGWLKR